MCDRIAMTALYEPEIFEVKKSMNVQHVNQLMTLMDHLHSD